MCLVYEYLSVVRLFTAVQTQMAVVCYLVLISSSITHKSINKTHVLINNIFIIIFGVTQVLGLCNTALKVEDPLL